MKISTGVLAAVSVLLVCACGGGPVKPSGTVTYRLAGIVQEPDGRLVTSARVEAISGPSGLETTTDAGGSFVLHGVPLRSTIRITKNGYVTREEEIVVTDHALHRFELSMPPGRMKLEGEWTLTITASSSCSGQLLAQAVTRRCTGFVTQRVDDFIVTLRGPQFFVAYYDHNQIFGTVRETDVKLSFTGTNPGFPNYQSLIEIIGTSLLYVPYGEASLLPSPNGYSGQLNGSITVGDLPEGSGYRQTANCTAPDHQIVMQRR